MNKFVIRLWPVKSQNTAAQSLEVCRANYCKSEVVLGVVMELQSFRSWNNAGKEM